MIPAPNTSDLPAKPGVVTLDSANVVYAHSGVFRSDSMPARSVTRTDEGYLMIDAAIGAVGILQRRYPDGKVYREFRPPEELFRQDSMDTAKLKPITNNHPIQVGGILTPASASKFAVGTNGENIRQDSDLLMSSFVVHNKTAIDAIENGKREISPGYLCDLQDAPGEWNGQKYDFVQRNIRYNHVAIVDRARGGRQLSIKMDGDENYFQEENPMLGKVKLDSGCEYECPQEVVAAFNQVSVKLDAAEAQLVAGKSELDTLKADRDSLKVRLDEAEKRDMSGEISARVALASQVKAIVGDKVKLDSFDPQVLKCAAIAHRFPSIKLDGKSEDYVNAQFDIVINLDAEMKEEAANNAIGRAEGNAKNRPALSPAKPGIPGKDEPDGDEDPRAAMIKANYSGTAKSKMPKEGK